MPKLPKLDNIEIPALYSLHDHDEAFRKLVQKQFAKKFVTEGAKEELAHYVRCGHTISLTVHPSFVAARVRVIRALHKRRGTIVREQDV